MRYKAMRCRVTQYKEEVTYIMQLKALNIFRALHSGWPLSRWSICQTLVFSNDKATLLKHLGKRRPLQKTQRSLTLQNVEHRLIFLFKLGINLEE